MDIITTTVSLLNDTNNSCPTPLLWTQAATERRKSRLYICIVASVIHAIFWSQLLFCSAVRQKSMQWIYAYLITDIILLFRFFFSYIVRTTSTACEPSEAWVVFNCYFEATVDNYFNILEVYILLALNICRYVQIAYNRNVYRLYKKSLALAHVGIYLLSFLFIFFQFLFGWTIVVEYVRDRCEANYTNITIQVFNIIIGFALPISLNVIVIYASVRHVHLKSTLREGQHHVSAREKYHRTLVIQFLVFYTIWLTLWSPNIIVYQISFSSSYVTMIVRSLNFSEVAIDPFIIAALDVRFWQSWKKIFLSTRDSIIANTTNHGRVQPSTTNPAVIPVKTPRQQATRF
jgi:hypothetical protein